jgi:catechol 2,3-dioxygenase-like lactoylglutathione lyase family enzyme
MIQAADHIGICVYDLDRCIPFYRDVLGLKQVADFEMTGKFLDMVQGKSNMDYRIVKFVSPEGFMFELLQDRGHEILPQTENSLQGAGFRHFAFEIDDVEAFYRKVKLSGYETISGPCTSEDGTMRLFFLRDPEMNLIELIQLIEGEK